MDTYGQYHLLEVIVELLEFSQELKCVIVQVTFKDKQKYHLTKEIFKVNVEAFAHNSQNLIPRFMKMVRDFVTKELGTNNRNYNNYSDFLIDSLPSKEVWQEAGLFQYNLATIQEIKRLMVALLAKKFFGCYSLVGFHFEPFKERSIPLYLLMNYFQEKQKIARTNLRNMVVELEVPNYDHLETISGNLLISEPVSPYSRYSNLSSPTSSLRMLGKTLRSSGKKRGFMMTNPSLVALQKEKIFKNYLKSKDQLNRFLGWHDMVEEGSIDFLTDKLVVKSKPLEIINLKHEHEFYQCVLEFSILDSSYESVQKRDSKRFTLSDFCIIFSILSRNREVLHQRTLNSQEFCQFLRLDELQALSYCMIRLSKSPGKIGQQNLVYKAIVDDARRLLLSRKTTGQL